MSSPIYDHVKFDPKRPVSSSAQILMAFAGRLARSIVLAIAYLPGELLDQAGAILHPDNLWTLAVVFAGWLLATIVGGPLGAAVNGVLLVWGIVELWGQLKDFAAALSEWGQSAYAAKSDADIDKSAQLFSRWLVAGGLLTLQAFFAHKIFAKVRAEVTRRAPTPKWLAEEYEQRLKTAKSAKVPPKKNSKLAMVAAGAEAAALQSGMLGAANKIGSTEGILIGGLVAGSLLVGAGVLLATSGKRGSRR